MNKIDSNVEIAIQATIEAGAEILKIYHNPTSDFSIEKKADNSPLTIADKASHNVIEKFLLKTNIPILSEEGKSIEYSERKNWETFWLIDPLDGTKEFIKRNDEFTVNIALIKNGKPVMGVIYVPVQQLLYVGDIREGAWKLKIDKTEISFDDVKNEGVKLPQPGINKTFTIVGSRSHMSAETEKYINELQKEHKQIEIISKGSSLKLCMVAEGLADIYPRFAPTMEWDTAAGDAVVRASGGTVINAETNTPLVYNKEKLLNPWFVVKRIKGSEGVKG